MSEKGVKMNEIGKKFPSAEEASKWMKERKDEQFALEQVLITTERNLAVEEDKLQKEKLSKEMKMARNKELKAEKARLLAEIEREEAEQAQIEKELRLDIEQKLEVRLSLMSEVFAAAQQEIKRILDLQKNVTSAYRTLLDATADAVLQNDQLVDSALTAQAPGEVGKKVATNETPDHQQESTQATDGAELGRRRTIEAKLDLRSNANFERMLERMEQSNGQLNDFESPLDSDVEEGEIVNG